MFGRWGGQVVRLRWWMLSGGLVFVLFGGVWGTSVFGSLVGGGFDDPHSQSAVAQKLIDDRIGHSAADVVVLFDNPAITVDDPGYRPAVQRALLHLPPGVARVNTFWTTGSPVLVSTDRHATYAAITLADPAADITLADYDAVKAALAGSGFTARIGGPSAVNADITTRVSSDIARAESLSMPILLVLLVFIFGSVVAASLPLAIGGMAILGAFSMLKVISLFTDVSIFSVNIVTILGLGLAIDYGLFVLDRFREELRGGLEVEAAVLRTMASAGRTVAVSAVTVAVSLSGLLIFPQTFLRSMGMGGVAAVAVAAIGALTVLPAMLAVLGHRVEALSVRPLLARVGLGGRQQHGIDTGFWFRLASSVMRRPVAYVIAVVALLALLSGPFWSVTFGGVDARVLPAAAQSRQVSDALLRDFAGSTDVPIESVLSLDVPASSSTGQAAIQQYLQSARAVPGAHAVTLAGSRGQTAQVSIGFAGQALDAPAKKVLSDVRALPRPDHVSAVHVGGQTATIVDRLSGLGNRLPVTGGLIALATFVLLFLAFGSVVLPVKAIVMNVLSLGASFGAVTWIFADGHLSGLLGFTSTGALEATQPILVLAIVFGLSMDYEVFLLSRIREEYLRTGDNRRSVAIGVQRSGRIITSAALLLMVVIGAFSTSSISFIKLIGVAMLIGILIDATVVRSILVPATMRLLGGVNWWAPASLRRLHERFGFSESDPAVPVVAPEPAQQEMVASG